MTNNNICELFAGSYIGLGFCAPKIRNEFCTPKTIVLYYIHGEGVLLTFALLNATINKFMRINPGYFGESV